MQQSTSGTPQQYPSQQMIIRPNMPPQQQMSQTPLHQQPHFMQQQQHISVQQQNGVIPQAQVNSHLNHQNQTAPPNVTFSTQNGHMTQSNTSIILNFIFGNVRV